MRVLTSSNLAALQVLLTMPGAAGAAAPAAAGQGINSTEPRPADADVQWPEGDLPEQQRDFGEVILPQELIFRLPPAAAMPSLWHDVVAEDKRPTSRTKGQKLNFRQLKFDKNVPLVIVGGPHDGEAFRAQFSTVPRPRGGKADDPTTPWVSDIAYLLSVSLQDTRRPANQQELEAIINSYGGREIRVMSGLSGNCRPDANAKIEVYDPTDTTYAQEHRQPRTMVIDDPTGRKGCGKRYYTRAFKNPNGGAVVPGSNPVQYEPKYFTEVQCDNQITVVDPTTQQPVQRSCDAIVRGWPQVETFLPPVPK